MTDVRSYFEKEHLGAWNLPDGKDVVVVIESCKQGTVKNKEKSERKPVLYFSNVKDRSKGLVLNATNAKRLIKLYGRHVEKWAGKPIALFVTEVDAFGETVDAIRIRPTAPPMPAKGAAEFKDDDDADTREPGGEG